MTDASSTLSRRARLSPRTRRGHGCRHARHRRVVVADAAAPSRSPRRQGRPFWARLDNPFTVGLLLTLGGLVALAARDRAHQHRDDPRLHRTGDVRGPGPRPGDQVARQARRQARMGDRHHLPDRRHHRHRPPAAGRADARPADHVSSSQDFPTTIANFEKSDFYAWLEGIFGTGLTDLINEVEKFLTDPKNIAAIGGGLLKVGAGIATAVSGLLIVVVLTLYFVASLPGIKDSLMQFAPARQPRRCARHDRPDHRLGRRIPHGHGHPGVLQLRGGDHPAPGPAACPTRC